MSDQKRTEVTQKILNAAISLWNEKSYEKTTMRELAKRLGMGVSSLYFYFRSKEEIVQHLYRSLNQAALEEFKNQAGESSDLGENFSLFLRVKLEILRPYRLCWVSILKESIDPDSPLNPLHSNSAEQLDRSVQLFEEMIKKSGLIPESKLLTLARVLGLVHFCVILYWMHDASRDFQNTQMLLEKIKVIAPFLGMLENLPGVSELLPLFTALFDRPSAAPKALEVSKTEELKSYDVIVIGGGPAGVLYASWVKLKRPKTKIVILERLTEATHKIGESTLSGFCKALRSVGIPQSALERLFYPKNGLGFFHVDESMRDLTQAPEYILESFDETFQVERRALDTLLLENARKIGVEIIQGAEVQIDQSSFEKTQKVIAYTIRGHLFKIEARLVADASGPAGLISKQFRLNSKERVSFQTSAVWAYFKNIKALADYPQWPKKSQFPRDHYTQHLCFKEGWMWVIPLVSWQASPTTNLERMTASLLSARQEFPTREKLVQDYGCPADSITSIGIVLRQDRDRYLNDDPREAFEHYSKKYPTIRNLLNGAELLEGYYENSQTFMTRLSMRHHARQMVGDGWLLIGDAAFFVDPLISPGLTGGAAQSYFASEETVKALDSGKFNRDALLDYENFNIRLHQALERDNQLVYMSFNHPEAVELIQRFQEIDARKHFQEHRKKEYSIEDTNVWGILHADYQELQNRVWSIMREEEQKIGMDLSVEEQSPADYAQMVERLKDCLNPYLETQQEWTPYVQNNRKMRTV